MDARVRYTKKVVKEVFLELLKNMPLDKITVTEICDRAQINRATFYKYYKNPTDLLKKLEDDRIDELNRKIREVEPGPNYEVFRMILTDMKANKDFYQTVLNSYGDIEFRDRLFTECYDMGMKAIQKIQPNMPEQKRIWLFAFVAEGFNGILNIWEKEGMETDVDVIFGFAKQLISGALHLDSLS